MAAFDTDHNQGIDFAEFADLVCDRDAQNSVLDTRTDEKSFHLDQPSLSPRPEGNLAQVMRNVESGDFSNITQRDFELVQEARKTRKQLRLEEDLRDLLHKRGKLKELFRHLDEDASGTVSTKEFTKGMQQFLWGKGIKAEDEQLQIIVNDVDEDGDGRIQYKEFFDKLGIIEPPKRPTQGRSIERLHKHRHLVQDGQSKQELVNSTNAVTKIRSAIVDKGLNPDYLTNVLRAFKGLGLDDLHADLTIPEFRHALKQNPTLRITAPEMDSLLNVLDQDRSGTISFREFADAMGRNPFPEGPQALDDDSMSGLSEDSILRIQEQTQSIGCGTGYPQLGREARARRVGNVVQAERKKAGGKVGLFTISESKPVTSTPGGRATAQEIFSHIEQKQNMRGNTPQRTLTPRPAAYSSRLSTTQSTACRAPYLPVEERAAEPTLSHMTGETPTSGKQSLNWTTTYRQTLTGKGHGPRQLMHSGVAARAALVSNWEATQKEHEKTYTEKRERTEKAKVETHVRTLHRYMAAVKGGDSKWVARGGEYNQYGTRKRAATGSKNMNNATLNLFGGS